MSTTGCLGNESGGRSRSGPRHHQIASLANIGNHCDVEFTPMSPMSHVRTPMSRVRMEGVKADKAKSDSGVGIRGL